MPRAALLTLVASIISSWSCASNAGPAAPHSDWALDAVGAPAAWSVTRGEGILVAIIDSGVDDRRLPSLISRDQGHYESDGEVDTRPSLDPVGHGTAIASVAVGSGDLGVDGVAPAARFVAISVTSAKVGSSAAALGSAIRLAVKHGAQVINLSLGSFASDSDAAQEIEDAIRANVIVVAAAGDTASSTSLFPASLSDVIAVRGLDSRGYQGPRANPVGANGINAPGSMVPAVLLDQRSREPSAGVDSGSSLATAIVSGAVALMVSCLRSAGRESNEAAVLQALVESAKGRTFFQIRNAMKLVGCAR